MIEPYVIEDRASIMEAMQQIENNARGIVFVCNQGKLIACVTDGDVRRHLLAGGKLTDNVSSIANYQPIFLKKEQQGQAERLMEEKYITAVPIVNEKQQIVHIYFLREQYLGKEEKREQLGLPLVIMAGGKGTRLKPYTDILPKPLIPIGEKTITEHIMERFAEYGCDDVIMIVNYKKEFIKSYFKESENPTKIQFVEEQEYYGTGGGLKLLDGRMKSTFFMSNCDILIHADYARALDYHKTAENMITLVCAKKTFTIPYGTIQIDDEGKVITLNEKPGHEYNVNTGFYIIEPEFIKRIPDNTFIHITDVIEKCVHAGERVGTYLIEDEDWLDMGQLDELEKMRNRLGVQA